MAGGRAVRDAFAVQNALSLGLETARAMGSPALDPRLCPMLDDLAAGLLEVRGERGLAHALAGLAPLLEALAAWPAPPAGRHGAIDGPWPPPSRPASWHDVGILRFAAALGALRALQQGPDGAGRTLAALAVDLGRRAAGAPGPRGHARPRAAPRAASTRHGRRATPSCAWRSRSRAT